MHCCKIGQKAKKKKTSRCGISCIGTYVFC